MSQKKTKTKSLKESTKVASSSTSSTSSASSSSSRPTTSFNAPSFSATLASTSSTQNSHSKSNDTPPMVGYVHNVSPTKISQKGSEYFTFNIQQQNQLIKAVCFSPKKHKPTVEIKAETGNPCKLTKYSLHASDKNVIWINNYTQIADASETTVDFSPHQHQQQPILSTTKELNNIQVYQSVNIRGYVLFGDSTPQTLKEDLVKKEACLVDQFGTIRMTLWNEQIDSINEGFYEIQNIRIRQYFGEKFLSAANDTVFKPLEQDQPHISAEVMKEAKGLLTTYTITCDNIITVDVQHFYSCLKCAKRVQYQHDTPMLRCTYCQSRFLIKNSHRSTTARISLKANDGNTTWYTLFTPHLEQLLKDYNDKHGTNEIIGEIDEDQLCQIILEHGSMTLKVNNKNVILDISFA